MDLRYAVAQKVHEDFCNRMYPFFCLGESPKYLRIHIDKLKGGIFVPPKGISVGTRSLVPLTSAHETAHYLHYCSRPEFWEEYDEDRKHDSRIWNSTRTLLEIIAEMGVLIYLQNSSPTELYNIYPDWAKDKKQKSIRRKSKFLLEYHSENYLKYLVSSKSGEAITDVNLKSGL